MVNLRTITQKVTKEEAKDLLDKAQDIINKDILGPNFKREKLLSGDKGKKKKVKIDGEEKELIDGETTGLIKVKTKVPKPDEKPDKILFDVKTGGKITPKMLADFNINKMNSKDDILKFIDEVSEKYKKDITTRKRGVQSQEDTKKLAALLQKDQTKLSNTLLNLKKGETLNAEYILATRELVEASYAKLDILAQKAIQGGPDEVLAYRQHMALTAELTKILKGVQTGEDAQSTNTVKVEFEDLTTVYALLHPTENLYLKVGFMQVDLNTVENLATGGAYGNTSLDGYTLGVGYNHDMDNGAFVRVETNYMEIDGTELTNANDSTKKVKADGIEGASVGISVGKSF